MTQRLAKERDIMQVYRKGNGASSSHLSIKMLCSRQPQSRLAIVVSKKIDKRAVVRNKNRRRLRPIIQALMATEAGTYDIVVTVRQSTNDLAHPELNSQVADVWRRGLRTRNHRPSPQNQA